MTYGTFRSGQDGHPFPGGETVERDFRAMARHGVNTVRTYTVPPPAVLDCAGRHGLRVLVGVPWEQHIAFLDDRRRCRDIERRVREAVASCSRHPAVLGFAVGNEIPASIVRFHGQRRTESFLRRLYEAAKAESSDALVTYVNYPSTEYLDLSFFDVCCFNVFLERREPFEAYLARLQNIAGNRPLVVTELGLDSRRAGEEAQAASLAWQVSSCFAAGCAGAFVFSWTDEWHRGGHDVEDWDFGLTTRGREPKPALLTLDRAFADVPFPRPQRWPRISVVVCTYNGSRTLPETLEGIGRLRYPDFEVILVNDGSTDATEAIARRFPVQVISTENRGLSSARNTGWRAATGEIVAYIDDDASPDPNWLTYLAQTFLRTNHAAAGGPNLPPPCEGAVAHCVAHAPGGPTHILLSDTEAEHVPGCNMAFRREVLEAVGGFDERFRVAGDDVDICWAIHRHGATIGFSPAAFVWHRRRASVRAYWRQQEGYGKAEALLEAKWPERYNTLGHVDWRGRIYGHARHRPLLAEQAKVLHGTWGTAPFQSLYEPVPTALSALPLMPEWFLVLALSAALAALGAFWRPLLVFGVVLAVAAAATAAQALHGARQALRRSTDGPRRLGFHGTAIAAWLYWIQPQARLIGRLRAGLTPFRYSGYRAFLFPRTRRLRLWNERWEPPERLLARVEAALRTRRVGVLRGGDFDRWDLEVRGGVFGAARTLAGVEEHGAGKQMFRFQVQPRFSPLVFASGAFFGALAVLALLDHAPVTGMALAGLGLVPGILGTRESGLAMAALRDSLEERDAPPRACRPGGVGQDR